MKCKLNRREILAHLDAILAAVSADPKKDITFLDRVTKLRALVENTKRDEITLADVHKALLEGLNPDSRRTTFSTFRTALSNIAEKLGRSFALVQPHGRGKSTTQIPLYFEGSSISLQPAIDETTGRAVAGLDRQNLIEAPAAFLTGEFLNRLVRHFADPQTAARLPVRFFLSYSHKNSKLKNKLLDALADELAISRRFAFSIWQDKDILVGNEWHTDILSALDQCDLCLSLLSPAFLASAYIVEHEIPPIVAGNIPAIPVELEPLDFKNQNLRGFEDLQIFSPAFSKCATTAAQKDFASRLAHKIEEKVAAEALSVAQHFVADYLGGKREARELAERHSELLEILQAGETAPLAPPTKAVPAGELPTKLRINSLLTGCLKSLPPHLITPYAATGDLENFTRVIALQSANDDGPDPYSIFQQHQRSAVDYLAIWAQDPGSAPFAAVLGEIGSGKTTTLQMLAQRLSKDPAAPPVIFIDLREYFDPTPPTLEGILTDHLRRYDSEKKLTVAELIDAVRTSRAIIIFDGLDEKIISLADAARQNFIRELWRILPPEIMDKPPTIAGNRETKWRILPPEIMDKPASSGRGKLVISCRSHYFPSVQAMGSGYVGSDRAAVTARDYLACVMLPWKDEQIREYLSGLLGEEHLLTALDLIDTVHNLKDLASRPYLISLIGPELEELEKDRAAGRTVNAAALYRKFIERWLYRDDAKHVFTPAHKLRLMENLAAALWRENARTWPWERVEEWLETFLHGNPVIASALAGQPITVLQQDFRTATFFLRPDACAESFRFAHTSLQEYFLACHLAHALEKSDVTEWDLPEPSRETFAFLGQHLLTLTAAPRIKALASLATLLGDIASPENTRVNALRYHLLAAGKGLPIPEAPSLDCFGLDLEGWEFHGTAERPLVFGEVYFAPALLLRTSFEHVRFQPGADFRDTDLRSARFFDCPLSTADFRGSLMDGAFFRECDLTGIQLDPRAEQAPVLAHLCPGSPWPQPAPPTLPSGFLAHGHADVVNSVAFSLDDRHILSGSRDNILELWDAASGKCIRSFSGHEDIINSVAFSHDDRLILSGSADNTLKLWDAASGKCIRSFLGHKDGITSVAFSHDDRLILSGSRDHTFKLWDAASGKCIRSFSAHEIWIFSVAFSHDDRLILSGSKGRTLKLCDAASGECIRSFSGHEDGITSVAFSHDDRLILSGSEDKTLKLWNAASGKCIRSFSGHKEGITSVAFSHDDRHILSGSDDNTLKLWDAASGKCIRSFSGHKDIINSVAFSHDDRLILSGSKDKTLKLWDPASGKCIRSWPGHENVAFSHHERLRAGDSVLREILPLPGGQSIVREPWDEDEAHKPYHEIRWKFTHGPADAWRWCHVVDPETNAIHPPELAAVPGAFSGSEVGPV